MRTFLNNITLDEIKTSLENLWQRMIQLSEFFQYSFMLILKRKCLVGASRVRCGESGTPSTITYTWWSSRRYELGCHAPVLSTWCKVYVLVLICWEYQVKDPKQWAGLVKAQWLATISQATSSREAIRLEDWKTAGCTVANFDDLVKFCNFHQIRRSWLFIKLAFEFGCDVMFTSHPIKRWLYRQYTAVNIDFHH